jgi:hypothetical protein
MDWTFLGTIATVFVAVAWLVAMDLLGLSTGVVTGFFAWLFGRGVWQFADSMENKGFDDPVYKKNLQRLIERNRQFEEARKARHDPHS